MKIEVSREIKERLFDGNSEPSPFEKIGSQYFCKFDSIEFDPNIPRISFKLNNKIVFWVDGSNEKLHGGTITVVSVEGRMPISIGG